MICRRCGGPTAANTSLHPYSLDCVTYLSAVRRAALRVASLGWGTSVSEHEHFRRMEAMDQLRAILGPPEAARTVNRDSPDSAKETKWSWGIGDDEYKRLLPNESAFHTLCDQLQEIRDILSGNPPASYPTVATWLYLRHRIFVEYVYPSDFQQLTGTDNSIPPDFPNAEKGAK